MISINTSRQTINTSVVAIFFLVGFSACLRLGTVQGVLTDKEEIKVHDIHPLREDPALVSMWVLYDPVVPPAQDKILAKVKYECDRFCNEHGYYGYVIEKSYDYELDKGMQIEVRFFGLKWDRN
jgi:hypothetical protein